jgi:hypothetical protein
VCARTPAECWHRARAAYPRRCSLKRECSLWLEFGWIPRKSARPSKGIICDDISEFESHMPSHAVGSLWRVSLRAAPFALTRSELGGSRSTAAALGTPTTLYAVWYPASSSFSAARGLQCIVERSAHCYQCARHCSPYRFHGRNRGCASRTVDGVTLRLRLRFAWHPRTAGKRALVRPSVQRGEFSFLARRQHPDQHTASHPGAL